jgi:hypothetical protein
MYQKPWDQYHNGKLQKWVVFGTTNYCFFSEALSTGLLYNKSKHMQVEERAL